MLGNKPLEIRLYCALRAYKLKVGHKYKLIGLAECDESLPIVLSLTFKLVKRFFEIFLMYSYVSQGI
jgi:hypothetical protein